MYVVSVIWEVKEEAAEKAAALLIRQAENSLSSEEACRRFDVARDGNKPVFLLYELYDDEAAFKAHTQTPHFEAFAPAMEPLTVDKQIRFWTLMDRDDG